MSGVNSFGVQWAGQQLAELLRPGMHVIALAKGMQADEDGNLTIRPRVLANEIHEDLRNQLTFSAIAGPSIAGEVAVHRHPSVVFTGDNAEVLEMWRELFATEHYHVWTNTDFVGVEVCAATKNCYAFGAGFMSGILDAMGEAAGDRYVNFNYGAALPGTLVMWRVTHSGVEGFLTSPATAAGAGGCSCPTRSSRSAVRVMAWRSSRTGRTGLGTPTLRCPFLRCGPWG